MSEEGNKKHFEKSKLIELCGITFPPSAPGGPGPPLAPGGPAPPGGPLSPGAPASPCNRKM